MGATIAVIVVDPERKSSTALHASLSAEGFHCKVAASAAAALDALGAMSFQAMLVDMCLPHGEAIPLVERARKSNPDLPIVVMAADIDPPAYDRAIEAGASDFIVTPFRPTELVLRLKHVIRQERLRVMSITDELTGLSNRRGFYALAEQQMKIAARQKRSIYLLYADVNGLKAINDTRGHGEGDNALVEVANILRSTCRQSDIVARIGGDEFVFIPIGTTGDDIPAVTGRLRRNLQAHNAASTRPYRLSLSIGVACFDPANPATIDELLAEGDRSMYEDKRRASSEN